MATAMIQQPRVPPTGQRQAIEVHIKWREVLDYKRDLLRMLSIGTGWNVEKLDAVSGVEWSGHSADPLDSDSADPTRFLCEHQSEL